MAFFMDIIRDSRRRVAERREDGIGQWTGVPVGDVLSDQEGAVPRLSAEPNPRQSRVQFSRRRQPVPADQEKKDRRIEDPVRETSVEDLASESGRLSPEAASLPQGRREVEAVPQTGVTDRSSRRSGPAALQRKSTGHSPPLVQARAPSSGRDAVRVSPVETNADSPQQIQGVEPVATGAPERAPVAGTLPHPESSRQTDMPVSRPGMQVGGRERSMESVTPPGRIPLREATPGERVSIPEGPVEAQWAAPVHRRSEAPAGVQRRGESSPGSGLPVVRIGQVNVIVESAREVRKPKASATQGEDLASRTFLRSL